MHLGQARRYFPMPDYDLSEFNVTRMTIYGGVIVIALNLDDDADDARNFLIQHPNTLQIARTEDNSCPNHFEVQAMPSSFLIDRKGIIRHIEFGFKKGGSSEQSKRIEVVLAE